MLHVRKNICASSTCTSVPQPLLTGIMYFRYNAQTQAFVNSWLDTINAKPDYW